MTEQKTRKKKPATIEVHEGDRLVTYRKKTSIAEYLDRSTANLYTIFSGYEARTGNKIEYLRDGNNRYIHEDTLNDIIRVMMPMKAVELGITDPGRNKQKKEENK